MLSLMTFITIVLVFILGWCPLLTTLVYLAIPWSLKLRSHIDRWVDTYFDSIWYGLFLNAILAFIVGWIVVIIKLVS